MTLIPVQRFLPGTTGWRADDLDDPEISRQWDAGSYEIVEGVLTTMPPAYFDGGAPLYSLVSLVDEHLKARAIRGKFAFEVDLVLSQTRVAKTDAMLMLPSDLTRQRAIQARRKKGPKLTYGRIRTRPTLVIESVSIGHEDHDRITKRRWYAEAGIANYWVLDAYQKTLEVLVADDGAYRLEQVGRRKGVVKPSAFPGLVIPLTDVWTGD